MNAASKLLFPVLLGVSLLAGTCPPSEARAQPVAEDSEVRAWLLSSDGSVRDAILPFDTLAVGLPSCRDMALGATGDILLAAEDGRLAVLRDGVLESMEGSLPTGSWPEALGGDGPDWLVLHRQGREILRLGRRGELLASLRTPEGNWTGMRVSASGRIWLSDPAGERFVALGRSGQLLLDWDLRRLLPGHSGHHGDWAADPEGGLILRDGGRLARLNAAGNPETVWTLPARNDLRALPLGGGRALLLAGPERPRSAGFRRDRGMRLLSADGRLLLALPEEPESEP